MLTGKMKFTAVILVLLLLPLACSSSREKRDAFMERGQRLEKAGDLTAARLEYKNAIQVDPDCVNCFEHLGSIELKLKNLKGAFFAYSSAVKLDPDRLNNQIALGRILVWGGAGERAEKKAREILGKYPDNADAEVILALALSIQQDRRKEAFDVLHKFRLQYPARPEGYLIAARIDATMKKFQSAQRLLVDGMARSSDKKPFYHALMLLYSMQEEWDRAIDAARNFFGSRPEDPGSLMTMAQLYEKKGDMKKAGDQWQAAIRLSHDSPDVLIKYARFLLNNGRSKDATLFLQKCVDENQNNIKLRLALTGALVMDGQGEAALQLLDKVDTDGIDLPQRLALLEEKAYINFRMRRLKQAEELIKGILDENPKDIRAMSIKAEMALINKDTETAVAVIRQLRDEEPDNLKFRMMLAQAHALNGDLNLAQEQLEEILKVNPRDEKTWQALVKLQIRQKDNRAALHDIDSALLHLPDSPKLHNLKGLIQWAAHDTQGAGKSFRKAMELAPDWLAPYTNISALLVNAGNSEKAEKTLLKVVAEHPDSSTAGILLATFYQQIDRLDRAMNIYVGLDKKFPDSPVIHNNLAFLIAETSDDKQELAQALELITGLNEKVQDQPVVMDTVAWIYYKSGQTEKALDTINHAVAKAPDNSTLLYHQAVILHSVGRNSEALNAIKKALETGRPFPEQKKAEEFLKVLV